MTRKIHRRDLWETPVGVVDAVSRFFGDRPKIDLAASAGNAKAAQYVSEEGLYSAGKFGQSYTMGLIPTNGGLFGLDPQSVARDVGSGWAWMNPPYSRGNMEAFTQWARAYVLAGGRIALCHRPDLSTSWYQQNVLPVSPGILAPKNRIAFIPPDGVRGEAPNFASIITIMDKDRKPFGVLSIDWKK